MKICVLGLDCAAPEMILQDERLTKHPPSHGSGRVWPFRKRSSANHRTRLDVHDYEPGSRLTRSLRISQTVPTILTTKLGFATFGIDQSARDLGSIGKGREEIDHCRRAAQLSSSSYQWHQCRMFFSRPTLSRTTSHIHPISKTKITELVGEYPVDVKKLSYRSQRLAERRNF